ncbi:hypothetical protein KIK06_29000 [Nocardiopsis sp. EMB25]|uniref:hypothetical protein n=1 Tax=Nocardiopsis sp. EMB25 TaxID=2835867 RepID=UPI002284C98C|nr:hypothetical protein [Nocardiopsis sp. EMB25]MCY9787922.1 hypothetical protein [Nocardiopsis sp. EMB25]
MSNEWVDVTLIGGPMDGCRQPLPRAAVYGVPDPGAYLIPDDDGKAPDDLPGGRAVGRSTNPTLPRPTRCGGSGAAGCPERGYPQPNTRAWRPRPVRLILDVRPVLRPLERATHRRPHTVGVGAFKLHRAYRHPGVPVHP